MFAQEHFAATSLPAQVIHIVDVADQVSILEADHVPVLISAHHSSIITAKASGPSTFCKEALYVRILDCPAPNSIQPSGRAPENTSGRSCRAPVRSEEHTSELQSLRHLVCRLLLEK